MATPREGALGVLAAKGDLLGVTAAKDVERLPVGADGTVVTADSGSPLGLKYAVPSPTLVFCGGASMGSGDTGKHFGAQEGSNGGKNATLSADNQIASVVAGTYKYLTWESVSANATTVFKVVQNGIVVATVTLTGDHGRAVLTAAVAAEDLTAVEYDSGTAPGRTTVQVYAS